MVKQRKGEPPAEAVAISDLVRVDGTRKIPKHQVVFDFLHSSIQSGAYKPGDRLPSEAELGAMFDASRITVAKAVLELQRMNLVTRRPGAGTHVQAKKQADGYTFGLLIPELGRTEIFEPICHGMMRSPFARPDALLWGNAGSGGSLTGDETAQEAEHMAQYFMTQKVSGVFFAPLEMIPEKNTANRRIMRALEKARIPTVLLDRCYMTYPERSAHDLVGIDNRRTGYLATEHLLKMGLTRVVFIAEINSATTVDGRITGFYEALRNYRILPEVDPAWRGSPLDTDFVQKILDRSDPQGIVCANDVTAARMMQTLLTIGRRIPEDIRVVGIDDVKYASLLPIPLTTYRQPCSAIGAVSMCAMHERVQNPQLPARSIMVDGELVVRRSCGTKG